ncbi:MAG TPA: transglycosylase SLT domain-containing protein [Gaiellaceae bacterium]|nr:transglycosylase SLT domain-containing protein [Gaiellaceae bacterium]
MAVLFALAALVAGAAPPPPDAPVPRDPPRLAARLATTTRDLREAIDGWRAAKSPATPEDVTLDALYQQRIYLVLSGSPRLSGAVLRRLPAGIAREARDEIYARRELVSLSRPRPRSAFRVRPAEPPGLLRRYYAEAERRFGVSWRVLAAVNYVESAYNKLRNASSAGAQGPMQFLPSTWRVYGLGGDIHDPHDAIIGAANYLHANGAPRDYRRALYHYNPSSNYVNAVLRYVRLIRADARAFYVFYSRQVFVRTPRGLVRLTGPR